MRFFFLCIDDFFNQATAILGRQGNFFIKKAIVEYDKDALKLTRSKRLVWATIYHTLGKFFIKLSDVTWRISGWAYDKIYSPRTLRLCYGCRRIFHLDQLRNCFLPLKSADKWFCPECHISTEVCHG